MVKHDMIVIGASAGGIEALIKLVGLLPADLPASICVAVHVRPETVSNLPTVLRRASPLEAVHPRFHETIQQGYIYVAPPNWHMTLTENQVHLVDGPRENGARPAVDPLFRSAAEKLGPRVIGIVLSGSLDDGTAGIAAIKAHGGITIAQDPNEADFPSMPQSAIDNVGVDHVARVSEIASLVIQLTKHTDADPVAQQNNAAAQPEQFSTAEKTWHYQFSCPDCGGVLLPQEEGDYIHFRCEVGHMYSPQSLFGEQTKAVENGLWLAIRTLHEKARLATNIATQMRERGNDYSAVHFDEQAQVATDHADAIEKVLSKVHIDPNTTTD